jgi:hypothetical protein
MAIARDSYACANGAVATSKTLSFNNVGGNLALFAVFRNTATQCTCSYNGVAATYLGTIDDNTPRKIDVFMLLEPATGTHDVVFGNGQGSTYIACHAISYSGCSLTGQPDALHFRAPTSGTSISDSITVVAADCWIVAFGNDDNGGATYTGTGVVSFVQKDTDPATGTFDSNGTVLTGANTYGFTSSSSGGLGLGAVSILPAPTVAPPTVTTQAVSDITTDTATGNGNVTSDGGATITERGVCWGTSTNPTTGDNKATAAGTTGAFTVDITGLSAGTHYHVRAYAINSEGTSYGADVEFDTEALPPWRFENLNGLEFDHDDKKTIYAERLNEILDRLHALDGLEPDPEL